MIPYIKEAQIKRLLDEKTALRLAEKAFLMIAKKKTVMPPKMYLNLPDSNDFRAMPAFFKDGVSAGCGIKWVSVFPENSRAGFPAVYGTILLNSHLTGALTAVLEANTITAIRTGAAAALATRYLANPKPRILGIVGAGLQAEYQLRAMASLNSYREIRVWGYRPNEAKIFCRRLKGEFQNLRAVSSVEECVREADVIVTCTSSRKPLVRKEWIKKGCHINAIGADAKGKEELEPALLRGSKVVVDEWEQASHSGEINVPVSRGLFSKKTLCAELAEIVVGKKRGRVSASEITVFDSTGLAVLDICFAEYVRARLASNKPQNA